MCVGIYVCVCVCVCARIGVDIFLTSVVGGAFWFPVLAWVVWMYINVLCVYYLYVCVGM